MTNIITEINEELNRSYENYGKFNSTHEGYAVILEELDELWDEIRMKEPDKEKMKHEAMQTCAMLLKFINDLT